MLTLPQFAFVVLDYRKINRHAFCKHFFKQRYVSMLYHGMNDFFKVRHGTNGECLFNCIVDSIFFRIFAAKKTFLQYRFLLRSGTRMGEPPRQHTFIIGKTKCDSLEKRNGVKKHNLRKNETVLKNNTQ
jgi:hypothetical protein